MPNAPSLEEQIARLQALLEATRRVHSASSADEVLKETARILVRELEVEGAVFLAPDPDRTLAAYGHQPEPPFTTCPRFSLLAKDGSVLAELVVRNGENCSLSYYEQDFVEGLVLQAAVALENAMLHQRDLQWARVQRDLEAAHNIQRSLLPGDVPVIANHSLAWRSVACYEVGGDYLDMLELPDGSHLFIVADVAGKGLASAIMATSFRAAFRSLAAQELPLAEVMNRVGSLHWEEGAEARRRYVTAILVRLDPAKERLEIVNAGHNPGLLMRPDRFVVMAEASGTPLGLLPSIRYESESFDFPPGSRLLLYTDGLTEVFCEDDEFGCERLTELLRATATEESEVILDTIWRALHTYSNSSLQTDDMTALAICHRLARPEGVVRT